MEKPIQNFSLHTHTIGFDGRNTPREMASRARRLGMRYFGISNHFIVHPNITKAKFYPFAAAGGYVPIYSSSFDEVIAKFKSHYAELDALNDIRHMKIYRGMEVDFFDSADWMRGFENAVNILRPDYIICSTHFVEHNGMLCNVHDMAHADAAARNEMLVKYWNKLARAAGMGLFNWMAHLDLPKKTECGCEECWLEYEHVAINEIAKSKLRRLISLTSSRIFPKEFSLAR